MLVLLDPLLFESTASPSVRHERIQAARYLLQRLTKERGAALVAAIDDRTMFESMRALMRDSSQPKVVKDSLLYFLRGTTPRSLSSSGSAGEPSSVVRSLFTEPAHRELMWSALDAAARTREETILIVARMFGRNLTDRSSGGVELHSVSHWRILMLDGAFEVRCLDRERQLDAPWTIRVDPRLPDEQQGGRCPYCPPVDWIDESVVVHRTHESKPCWIDAHDNAWARPATGGGHHWDVYLAREYEELAGLSPVNITDADSKGDEGPGGVHHVPQNKRGRLKHERLRWRCREE